MICNNCGYINPDNQKYCAKCGKKFTRIQSELSDMNPEIKDIKEQLSNNEKYNHTQKSKGIPTSYKIIAVALIIAALILVVFASPGNNNTLPIYNDSSNNTSTPIINNTDNTTKAIQSTITVTTNKNLKAGDTANISGYLSDENNKKLIDCEIIVNIDGNEYKTHTDTKGHYQQQIQQITAGSHKTTVLYAGDENIKGSQNSTTLNVESRKSNITLEIDDQIKQSNKIIIKGRLIDDKNNPIANAQVKINIQDHEQTVNTDANGQYMLEVSNPEQKTQTITAKYEGDKYIEGSQATAQLKIEKEKTILDAKIDKKTEDKIIITGTLKNNKNDAIKDATVNLKTASQEITTNTNDSGKFSIETSDLNSKELILSYEGNDTTDSTQKSLEVEQEKIKTSITVKSNDTPHKGDPVTITGTLKDEKNHPLENAKITINDGTHEYTTTTNETGEYNYTISNISDKNANITVVYDGNTTYSECHDKIVIIIDSNELNDTITIDEKTSSNSSY